MRAPVNVGRDEASWLIKSSLLPELAPRLEKLIKQRWKRYRKQLKQVQQHFTETAIHDSRVETRRLISAVVLLQGFWPEDRRRKMENFLKAHLDSLNDLRGDLAVDLEPSLHASGKVGSCSARDKSWISSKNVFGSEPAADDIQCSDT